MQLKPLLREVSRWIPELTGHNIYAVTAYVIIATEFPTQRWFLDIDPTLLYVEPRMQTFSELQVMVSLLPPSPSGASLGFK